MELLKYHIQDTQDKFSEIKEELRILNTKFDDMVAFKIQSVATARMVSFIVSALCGLLTLIASTVISIKYK